MKFRLYRPMLRAWRSKTYRSGTLGRSLAIGMVIGFSPTVGAQALICLIFGLLWNRFSSYKLNLPAMLVGSVVVNPITMGPTYFLYYKIGCLVQTCTARITTEHFASFSAISDLGEAIVVPVVVGSIPFMLIGWPVGFWIGTRVERYFDNRRQKRQQRNRSALAASPTK